MKPGLNIGSAPSYTCMSIVKLTFPRSAGVGRTGTFITLDSMMERKKPYEFVKNLRKQRVLMVQTMVSLDII